MPARRLGPWLIAVAVALACAAFARGANPGANGRLLITSGPRHDQSLTALSPSTKQSLSLIPYGGDIYGTYSPDGTKIAFASNADGNLDVYSMNADGSGIRRLTKNSAGDGAPTWSPDGKKIAFASNRDGDFDIWVMNTDGSDPVNVTSDDPGTDDGPEWSPNGRWIGFDSNKYGYWTVAFVHPDGKYFAALTPDGTSDLFDSWSPDGQSLLIESRRTGNYDIYRYDLPQTDPIQFGLLVPTPVTDNPAAEIAAAWSPDGKQIAFSSNRDGNFEVYTTSIGGGPERRMTHNNIDDLVDDWQPLHDLQAPTARALSSSGRAGGVVKLRYAANDDTGRASAEIVVWLRKRVVWGVYTKLVPRQARRAYAVSWHAPAQLRDRTLKLCVTAYDPSGNESKRNCRPFRLR